MAYDIDKIIGEFDIVAEAHNYGNGHINDTYLLENNKYILQKINTQIFKDPERLMENIFAVTDFIRKKAVAHGLDEKRSTLNFINTRNGGSCYRTECNSYFRMYHFIDHAVTYENIENPVIFYNAARAFGRFQQMLSDFPVNKLHETIPNFHNTRSRFADFKEILNADKMQRSAKIENEINFVLDREKYTGVVVDALSNGEVPIRVTHNDTKLNNVLFEEDSDKSVCVIDLDTVMPGSALYDFGDALRFGANHGAEDDENLDNVYCDLELFEQFTKGYMEELGAILTEKEIELLPFSAILMTYECGMRFLGDYINGDTYFKIHHEGHNLQRARSQFKLVSDMENKLEEMQNIVKKYR